LRDDRQPQGTLETILVEELAVTFWHKRRVLQVEKAVISEKIRFMEYDAFMKQDAEAWDWSRGAIASGGLLKHSRNPKVVREAAETLAMFREFFIQSEFNSENNPILKRLYGQTEDGATPFGFPLTYELLATTLRPIKESGGTVDDAEHKKHMTMLIDGEIQRLKDLESVLLDETAERLDHDIAIIPEKEASDHLLSREAHFDRLIERKVNLLEHLQRKRKG
jgi:hypothetical protein